MGTNFFNAPKAYKLPSIRSEQSAVNAGRGMSMRAGNAAEKNLATAQKMAEYMKKPPKLRKKV